MNRPALAPPRVIVVEPHYDDAWLSLGGTLLLYPEVHATIVSVTAHPDWNPVDRTRLLLGRVPAVRATVALAFPDLGWDAAAVAARVAAEGRADATALWLADAGLESLTRVSERVLACDPSADAVFVPAGLFHPMHRVLSTLRFPRPTARYLEYPYRFYESERDRVDALRSMDRHVVDVRAVARAKRRIFDAVYPTQGYVLEREEHDVPLEAAGEEEWVVDEGWPLGASFGGFVPKRD